MCGCGNRTRMVSPRVSSALSVCASLHSKLYQSPCWLIACGLSQVCDLRRMCNGCDNPTLHMPYSFVHGLTHARTQSQWRLWISPVVTIFPLSSGLHFILIITIFLMQSILCKHTFNAHIVSIHESVPKRCRVVGKIPNTRGRTAKSSTLVL